MHMSFSAHEAPTWHLGYVSIQSLHPIADDIVNKVTVKSSLPPLSGLLALSFPGPGPPPSCAQIRVFSEVLFSPRVGAAESPWPWMVHRVPLICCSGLRYLGSGAVLCAMCV